MTLYTLKPDGPGRAQIVRLSPTVTSGPAQGTWTTPGGGTLISAVNDGSDTTYVRKTSTVNGDGYTWSLGTFTLPANECVIGFKWRVRMKRPLATSGFLVWFYTNAGYTTAPDLVFGGGVYSGVELTTTWVEGPWTPWPNPTTLEMSQDQINDLNLIVVDSATTTTAASYFYEVEVVVETTTRPKVSILSQGGAFQVTNKVLTTNVATLTTDINHTFVSGQSVTVVNVGAPFDGTYTLTAASGNTLSYAKVNANIGTTAATGQVRAGYIETKSRRPLLAWQPTDAEGDSQSAIEIYVYTEADAAAMGSAFVPGSLGWSTLPGSDTPDTTAPVGSFIPWVWRYRSTDSDVVDNSASRTIDASLQTGVAYRAYIRAYTHPSIVPTPGPRTGVRAQDWQYIAFTCSPVTPPLPEITVTPDTTIQANRVIGSCRVNGLTANQATLELGATTGWAVDAAGSPVTFGTVTGGLQKSGTYALSMTAGSAGGFMGADAGGVPVIGGQTYSVTLSVRTAVTARSVYAVIKFYDATGAYISGTNGSASNDSTSYSTRTVTAVAPAGSVTASAGLVVTGQANAEIHYVDEVALHPGATPVFSPGGAKSAVLSVRAVGLGQLLTTSTGSFVQKSKGASPVIASAKRSRSGLSQRWRHDGSNPATISTQAPGTPIVPGPLTFGARITTELSQTFTLTVYCLDAAGGATGNSTITTTTPTINQEYVLVGNYTAPANSAYAYLTITANSTGLVPYDIYIDDVFLSFGTVDPAVIGYEPARVRERVITVPASGLIDFVDEGVPVDNVPTAYFFDCITDNGQNASGALGASATVNSTPQWSLRVLADQARNVFGLRVLGPELDEDNDEQTETHWTLGSDYPTVLSGALGGEDGSLEILTLTDAEWIALRSALRAQSTLVLHPPMSTGPRGAEPKYVRVTKRSWKSEKFGSKATRRRLTLSYVETSPY